MGTKGPQHRCQLQEFFEREQEGNGTEGETQREHGGGEGERSPEQLTIGPEAHTRLDTCVLDTRVPLV